MQGLVVYFSIFFFVYRSPLFSSTGLAAAAVAEHVLAGLDPSRVSQFYKLPASSTPVYATFYPRCACCSVVLHTGCIFSLPHCMLRFIDHHSCSGCVCVTSMLDDCSAGAVLAPLMTINSLLLFCKFLESAHYHALLEQRAPQLWHQPSHGCCQQACSALPRITCQRSIYTQPHNTLPVSAGPPWRVCCAAADACTTVRRAAAFASLLLIWLHLYHLNQHPTEYAAPFVPLRTADMAGDPFGLLLKQRIVFLGGEVRRIGW